MSIGDHLQQFEGRTVVDYAAGQRPVLPDKFAYRLALDYDAFDKGEKFVDLLASFVADPASAEVQALLIGDWGGAGQGVDSSLVVEALAAARHRLPKLRALFLGEITMEESEISWISQSDVSPLFTAFADLESLYLRGGNGLQLGRPRHAQLRKLVIETGGMSVALLREVTSGDLPALRDLELWLGDEEYGNDVTTEDIAKLLAAGPCSRLIRLGLRDDCRADDTAKLLAAVGVPETLEELDLSMGTLGDEGANALLASDWLPRLKHLDIHHHYVTGAVVESLRRVVASLNADDVQEPDNWDGEERRYVAVGE
jgi:hypothetical protein